MAFCFAGSMTANPRLGVVAFDMRASSSAYRRARLASTAMTSKPWDWMKSEQWLANIGHFLGGAAYVFLFGIWSRLPIVARAFGPWWPLSLVTLIGVAGAAAKEYLGDLHEESDETVASSTEDFLGYVLGGAVAWANILLAHHFSAW